jgi:endonuclease
VLLGLLVDPTPDDLVDFLRTHMHGGDALVMVAGTCEVAYVGRATSFADAGDYVVMVKADGSIQVHGYKGVKPVNWQPRSDDLWVGIDDAQAVLVAERRSPDELVRVVFLEPALAQALHLREGTGFVLRGTEAEMQRALAHDPSVIEDGLVVLDRELPTDVGGIDLFARDRYGRLVVVELKRAKGTQEAVHQLARYVESVRRFTGEEVRGVLAAPSVTKPALVQLAAAGLEFAEVLALPDIDVGPEQGGLFETG